MGEDAEVRKWKPETENQMQSIKTKATKEVI